MNFKNLNFLVVIIYLISSNIAYSIDLPDIKNLIIHKEKKKVEYVEFLNSKSEKVSLNDFKSNFIVINFWATWCSPCKEEMPSLNRLKSNHKFKGIKIIPINIGDEKLSKSQEFFNDLNIYNLEIFSGSSGELAKKFQLRGVPTTILIDKDGYEIGRILGYFDFEKKVFLDWLINYL
tara:strand:- start:620 stop:1150 length:531 start_codon:yes stop_codon:yes gene_type:complete